jgi:hypothetical protein
MTMIATLPYGVVSPPSLDEHLRVSPRGGPVDFDANGAMKIAPLEPLPEGIVETAELRALRRKLLAWDRAASGKVLTGAMVGGAFGVPFGFCLVLIPVAPVVGAAGAVVSLGGAFYASRSYRPSHGYADLLHLIDQSGAGGGVGK